MDPNGDPILPERMKGDLSALYRAEVLVPAEVDRAVTSGARAYFTRRSRWVRWVAAGSAVAAAVIVSVVVLRPEPAAPTRVARDVWTPDGDADGNNVVDIRDALVLARKVESGRATWTRWEDVNHDKVIDRKDVDAIAMMAVSLGTEVVR